MHEAPEKFPPDQFKAAIFTDYRPINNIICGHARYSFCDSFCSERPRARTRMRIPSSSWRRIFIFCLHLPPPPRQDKLFVVCGERTRKDILFASKQTCREHNSQSKAYFLWEPREVQLLRFPLFVFPFSCTPHCVCEEACKSR